jgi:hypothetical protein
MGAGYNTEGEYYYIGGNNNCKLRDLAYVLSGTEKQFEIGWDAKANAETLTSGQSYTEVGGERRVSMEWCLLEKIPFFLDEPAFLTQMRIKPGSAWEASCQELIGQALIVARPRAVYLPKCIDCLDETGMTVDGVRLQSKLFKPHLKTGERIYFFFATCGAEINDWSSHYSGDLLQNYWADCLAEQALQVATAALEKALQPLIEDEYLVAMNPGSLANWPLKEQQPIFTLMGGAAVACGVSLNEHCVMSPQKSVSGFYFSSASEYYNCELCPRVRCPHRRAPFSSQA